jgi:hypothetical protein
MAISTAQYIDLLFKNLQGVAKTATATQKSASNESIASPALLRGDIVWTQSDQIPGTAQVVSGVTQGYLTTSRIECTADNTVPTIGGIYPTWLTNLQYWIPQEFGSTWPVKVWVDTAGAANPTVTGTQIFAPGIGGVGEFYFDTQAGVLNFIGETIPSTLTAGKSIFITGYRYVGQLGVTNLPSANIGNIQITGNTIVTLNTNGDLVFDPNGSGSVRILANTSVTGNVTASGFVSAAGNIIGSSILSNNYYYANGTPVPPGITYTANTAPPTSPAPKVTDQWYDTASDVLYEFINDGTSTYWVDTTSPAFAGGVVANVAISGTLVPIGNVTYDIGTSTVYFRNTYTQNLYTNNRLTASNMPSGAVVQTIMSTSLGGSATTGTSYSDIALANVVIQPSSANSKVLIIATGTSSFTPLATANLTASTQLVRTAASLQVQEYSANISGGGVGGSSAVAFSYLDSPNTTSPVTYKLQQKISNASSTLTSSNMWIIAMEIAVP